MQNGHMRKTVLVLILAATFALLTGMDELMLRILYNPALRPGMTEAEARPIVTGLAARLVGGES